MRTRFWAASVAAAFIAACTATTPPQPVGKSLVPVASEPAGQSQAPAQSGPSVTSASSVSIAQTPACGLIYNAEAASAVGVSIGSNQEMTPTSDGQSWLTECVYWRHVFQDEAPLDVSLASGDGYTSAYNDLSTETDTTAVPGIGDAATLRMSSVAGLDQPVGSLFVRIGNAVLSLSLGIVDIGDGGALVQVGDAAAQQKALVDLATIALGRLTSPPPPEAKICDQLSVTDASTLTGLSLTSAQDIDEHDILGPSCHYIGADTRIDLVVSVNSTPDAGTHFDSCKQRGDPISGVGDAAFIGVADCGAIVVDLLALDSVLMARSGDTVLTVGQRSFNVTGARDGLVAIARKVLGGLGLNAGTSPAPTAFDVLAHLCDIVTAAQASSILGVQIISADTRPGTCTYHSGDGSFTPLWVGVMVGPDAATTFDSAGSPIRSQRIPLAGLGDQAYSQTSPASDSYPATVQIFILSGQAFVQVYIDASGYAADGVTEVAPGTADQQLQMLTQVAQLILPQLPH